MDAILANAAQLNDVLLATDEGEYDNVALQVLQALRKLQTPDQTILLTVSPSSRMCITTGMLTMRPAS